VEDSEQSLFDLIRDKYEKLLRNYAQGISSKNTLRPLVRKERFPRDDSFGGDRGLILLDVENLARPDVGFSSARQALLDVFDVLSPRISDEFCDHIIVSCGTKFGSEKTAVLYGDHWPKKPRQLFGSGVDGADKELLKQLGIVNGEDYASALATLSETGSGFEHEPNLHVNTIVKNIAAAYDRIVIGSGDGIFEMAAIVYESIGMEVIVVSRPEALSSKLAKSATEVLLIPDVDDREELLRLNRVLGFRSTTSSSNQ